MLHRYGKTACRRYQSFFSFFHGLLKGEIFLPMCLHFKCSIFSAGFKNGRKIRNKLTHFSPVVICHEAVGGGGWRHYAYPCAKRLSWMGTSHLIRAC